MHWYVAYSWSYGHFCDFLAYFGQNLVAVATPLRPLQSEISSSDWSTILRIGRPRKPPVISNHILAISRRHGFVCIYSNFCPKIGCHGNSPLSLVHGSVTGEFPDSINPIPKPNSALMCCIQLKLWSFLWFFLAYLAKISLPWQRHLDPYNQKCLLWIGRPRKPPVISNHILVISRRNWFIYIYSNFSPEIGCHGNAPLSLVYGSVIDEFLHSTNLIRKPNYALMCCIQLKLWPFLWFFWLILAKISLPWQRHLDPCNHKCFVWIGRPRKPPVISNHILVISRRNGFICIYSNFSPKNWLPW